MKEVKGIIHHLHQSVAAGDSFALVVGLKNIERKVHFQSPVNVKELDAMKQLVREARSKSNCSYWKIS